MWVQVHVAIAITELKFFVSCSLIGTHAACLYIHHSCVETDFLHTCMVASYIAIAGPFSQISRFRKSVQYLATVVTSCLHLRVYK